MNLEKRVERLESVQSNGDEPSEAEVRGYVRSVLEILTGDPTPPRVLVERLMPTALKLGLCWRRSLSELARVDRAVSYAATTAPAPATQTPDRPDLCGLSCTEILRRLDAGTVTPEQVLVMPGFWPDAA